MSVTNYIPKLSHSFRVRLDHWAKSHTLTPDSPYLGSVKSHTSHSFATWTSLRLINVHELTQFVRFFHCESHRFHKQLQDLAVICLPKCLYQLMGYFAFLNHTFKCMPYVALH